MYFRLSRLRNIFLFLVLLYGLYFVLFIATATTPIPPSSWKCLGTTDRNRICHITNLCVDRWHGPFVIVDNDATGVPPAVNLINANEDEDLWLQIKAFPQGSQPWLRASQHIKDTLYVYGLFSPFHFSHFLYNGLMPLFSTMMDDRQQHPPPHTASDWTLRAQTFWTKHTVLDMEIFPPGHDLVMDSWDVTSKRQTKLPMLPMCFDRAVVGTGNRCSLWYCERNIPHDHYSAFKSEVLNTTLSPQTNPCLGSVTEHATYGNASTDQPKTRVFAILNRAKSRHITNIPELITALRQAYPHDVIREIRFDDGCDMRSSAELVKDVDVLIASFGNGQGAGVFMKPNSIIISIDARYYTESWFYWPMTSIGIRLYTFECTRASCQEFEPALVKELAPDLSAEQVAAVMRDENPADVKWEVVEMYRKQVSRKVDVERFLPFLSDKLASQAYKCSDLCKPPFDRNGFPFDATV
ncbi:hypothetical protein DM01DRAFT_1335183 [Hesseltinella vesiculosa]|uniref:Glycosyltransferase 61 catalytic domain-containing protein n=1 Tax=Hesseltinella vesiculosa TaxID=101127 RepID=A0A1X2GKQ1_9FUNG|nr:hypothetical protein DM01DRAFT_1335183 [Hesseltinella vesiculosa]